MILSQSRQSLPLESEHVQHKNNPDPWLLAGMLITPIRLVIGWLFFSAFWRRVILKPAKLDPNAQGFIGEQLNHFLPHALFIKPMLTFLVTHVDILYAFLILFTLIEGAVGLALLLGLMTRFAALGVTLLSWGILIGAGWLGTTCLDEWQIGASGLTMGLCIMLAGAGPWSLDHWLSKKYPGLACSKFWRLLSTGSIPNFKNVNLLKPLALSATVLAMGWTLFTYQAFFEGIWGNLHNPSVKPHISLSNPEWNPAGYLKLTVYRDGGPDTYGAFLIGITLKDDSGKSILHFDEQALASLKPSDIHNHFLVKTRSGKHSLVVPLGSRADIRLKPTESARLAPGQYQIIATDVSGVSWKIPYRYTPNVAFVQN